eukprot:gene24455-29736_t
MGDTCADNAELLDDSSDGEDIPLPEPASQVSVVPRHLTCGDKSLPPVCRAAVLPTMVSALMCTCAAAAAAPPTDQVFGGVSLDPTVVPGRTVGGAVLDYIVPDRGVSIYPVDTVNRRIGRNDFAVYNFWLCDSW